MCWLRWLSMTASAANSPEFLITADLLPSDPAWTAATAQVETVREAAAPILGFVPDVKLVSLAQGFTPTGVQTFVFPATLDFSIIQKDKLGQILAETRRA